MSDFTDCYQFHIGVISGTLRALGAPQEATTSLNWIVSQIGSDTRETEVGNKLDELLGETPRQKAVDAIRQPALSNKAPVDDLVAGLPVSEKAQRGWTASQEDELVDMVRAGDSPAKCALHFKKGYQATYAKITALKDAGRI